MKRTISIIIITLISISIKAQLDTEIKVAKHVDSLSTLQRFIRLAGLDHENVKGLSCMVKRDGTVNLKNGTKKFTVATNPIVMWTGNPGKFITKFMASGGARKMLTYERLEHIMARHFHPSKYSAGITKGAWFSPAMNVKRLYKYIDKTIRHGECVTKGNRLIFTKALKNPEGFVKSYRVILNKKGTIITAFPLK